MITLTWETKALIQKLQDLSSKGIRYAVSMAMTWTAADAKEAFDREIQSKIDRPRPITKGATRYKMATKDRTSYDVFIKGDDWDEGPRGKEVNPNQYLKALVLGGYRANKKSEVLLMDRGLLPRSWQLQPGADAKLDAYGNIPGSKYTQMLSALKAFPRGHGYEMNRVTDGRTGRNPARDKRRARTATDYFILWSIKDKTPMGIYIRQGKSVKQLWKFVPKRARYNKILNFKETIARTFNQVFEKHFREGLERMIIKVSKW